ANFFSNKNSNFGFLLVSDSLKAYPIRELEFRDCKTFARVPPRALLIDCISIDNLPKSNFSKVMAEMVNYAHNPKFLPERRFWAFLK
ncbi:MAG: hypothetical protein ACKPI8_09370, partial [Microcystis panniformis]